MPQSPWRIAGRGGWASTSPFQSGQEEHQDLGEYTMAWAEQWHWGEEVRQLRKSDKGSIILGLLSFCFYRPRRSLKYFLLIFF